MGVGRGYGAGPGRGRGLGAGIGPAGPGRALLSRDVDLKVRDLDGGAALVVTSKDKDVQEAIKDRLHRLVKAREWLQDRLGPARKDKDDDEVRPMRRRPRRSARDDRDEVRPRRRRPRLEDDDEDEKEEVSRPRRRAPRRNVEEELRRRRRERTDDKK
jgi:hypothetical protein